MFFLAMALSIFTAIAVPRLRPSPWDLAVTLCRPADRGRDLVGLRGFLGLPALVWVIHQAIEEEGSASALVDRLLHREPLQSFPRVPRGGG